MGARTPPHALYSKPLGSSARPGCGVPSTHTPGWARVAADQQGYAYNTFGFPIPRSTCCLPDPFLRVSPVPPCPLAAAGHLAAQRREEWTASRQPRAQIDVDLTLQHETHVLPVAPGTKFLLPLPTPNNCQEEGKDPEGQTGRGKGRLPHPAIVRGPGSRNPYSKASSKAQPGLENPETPGKRDRNPGGTRPERRWQRVIFNLLFLALRQKLI